VYAVVVVRLVLSKAEGPSIDGYLVIARHETPEISGIWCAQVIVNTSRNGAKRFCGHPVTLILHLRYFRF